MRTTANSAAPGGRYDAGPTTIGGAARVLGGVSVRPRRSSLVCRQPPLWGSAGALGLRRRCRIQRRCRAQPPLSAQSALSDLVASESRHFFAVWELSALSPVTLMVLSAPPATAASDSTPVVTALSELSTKPTSSE